MGIVWHKKCNPMYHIVQMDLYDSFTNLSPDTINGRSCVGDPQLQLGRAGLQCRLLSNYRGKDI